MALGDPELLRVWEYDEDRHAGTFEASAVKRELYANLVVSHIESAYLAGLAPEHWTGSSIR